MRMSLFVRSCPTHPHQLLFDRARQVTELHCSDARFQLYNKGIGNAFVFIQRAPSMSGFELMTSIALQKKITKGDDVLYT